MISYVVAKRKAGRRWIPKKEQTAIREQPKYLLYLSVYVDQRFFVHRASYIVPYACIRLFQKQIQYKRNS